MRNCLPLVWICLAVLLTTMAHAQAPERSRDVPAAPMEAIDTTPRISVSAARSRAMPAGRAEAVESLLTTADGRQQVQEALPDVSHEDLDELGDTTTDGTQVSESENLDEYADVMDIDYVDWAAGVTFTPLRDAPVSTYVDETWPVGALRVQGLGAWSELNLRDMLDLQSVPLVGRSRAKLHLDLPDADGAWMLTVHLFIPDEVAAQYGLDPGSPSQLLMMHRRGNVKLQVEGPMVGGIGPRPVVLSPLRDGSGYVGVTTLIAPDNPRETQIEGMRQVTHTLTLECNPPAGYLLFGGITVTRL